MKGMLKNLICWHYIMIDEDDLIMVLNELDRDMIVSIKRCVFESGMFIIKINAADSEWELVTDKLKCFQSIDESKEIFIATGLDLVFKEL